MTMKMFFFQFINIFNINITGKLI